MAKVKKTAKSTKKAAPVTKKTKAAPAKVAPKAKAKVEKNKWPIVSTPTGRLSYPYLVEPDSGRENSDDKYKCDLIIPKNVWKEEGKKLRQAVLEVGRKFFKDKNLTLDDFKNPFKDTDELDKYSDNKAVKGCILVRAKSEYPPSIVNAQKEDLDEDAIAKIKGGDYARLAVAVYPYKQQGGGVTLGLNIVQFVKTGESFGTGRAASLATLDEMEIEDIDEEEDEEGTSTKQKRKANRKTAEDEDSETEDEDSVDGEEVDEDEDGTGDEDEEESADSSDDEAEDDGDSDEETEVDEDEDEPAEEDDAEDEDEAPRSRRSKKAASKKRKPADDDDEEGFDPEFDEE